MKRLFIVNPKAGNGRPLEAAKQIEQFDLDDFKIVYSDDPIKSGKIVSNYSNKGYCIYSVGGDGTLNNIINNMNYSVSSLGIIPCGSGNDFVRSINEKTKTIDLGFVNEKKFLNVASIGIDAEIADCANNLKINKKASSTAYVRGIIKTIPKYESKTVYIDDFEENITLLAVCNGKFYGNGIKIAPDAEINDGIFNIYEVSRMNKFKMIYTFIKLIGGKHEQIEEVHKKITTGLDVKSTIPLVCNVDGEIFKSDKFNFLLQPNAIKLVEEDNEQLKNLVLTLKRK